MIVYKDQNTIKLLPTGKADTQKNWKHFNVQYAKQSFTETEVHVSDLTTLEAWPSTVADFDDNAGGVYTTLEDIETYLLSIF